MIGQDAGIDIKDELRELLNKEDIDYGKILDLSSQLARLDPDFVRFSVDAGHISRLGRELVSRQETAVSELVKNAYDADASSVTVDFQDSDTPGGSLVIDDNGHGMTKEELIEGFMRLSTSDKIHRPRSPSYHRLRAGRKGIGRFAAQRLGKRLTLTTQTKDASQGLRVTIRWDLFKQDIELGSVAFRVETVNKEKEQGTTLLIEDLREAWSDAQIRRVYRYILDIIQPFTFSSSPVNENSDPGFATVLYRTKAQEKYLIADEEKMVFDLALATIEGQVDSDGYGTCSLTCNRLKLNETTLIGLPEDSEPFNSLRNIKLKAYYFNCLCS